MNEQTQPSQQEDYFTLREFLAAYNLSYHTYNKLRKAGKGPALVVLGPRNLRVAKTTAAEWFKSLEQKPQSSSASTPES